MRKWEYLTVRLPRTKKGFLGNTFDERDISAILYPYGQDGWEMVSCFTDAAYEGETLCAFAIMKREIA